MERMHLTPSGNQTLASKETFGFSLFMKEVDALRRRLILIKGTRGLAIFLGLSLAVWALSVLTVDHWNYARHVLILSRIVSLIVLSFLVAYFLLRPLFEQITDQRVARYIEERHPELQDRLVSVVECNRDQARGVSSNPFFHLLLRDAMECCGKLEIRSLFGRKTSLLPASLAGFLIIGFAAALSFGPNFLRYATLKLYLPWRLVKASPLYSIQVMPGTVDLPKGSELLVTAHLYGFDTPEVFLFSRHENSPDWEKRRMDPEKGSNVFRFLFLDVNDNLQYYVRSGTIQSAEFSITATEQPRVRQMDVTYHYPAYTGLAAYTDEDTGEIASVKGTNVNLLIQLNRDMLAGRILLQDGTWLPLSKKGPRSWEGNFQLLKDSSCRVQVLDQGRDFVTASYEYPIRVLDDRPPYVSFQKPGRDKKVTQIEEVLTEVKAEDDFGIRSLDLHYSVNGGKETVVRLFGISPLSIPTPADPEADRLIDRSKETLLSGIKPSRAMTATHTFFLEESKLEPGDLISYYATASDARSLTTSDIYFLEVRTFGKQYSQRQISQGPEEDAAAADTVLSIRQKEILAATWRLIRECKTFNDDEYGNNLTLVATQQYKLQLQTQSLSERIQRRALANRDKDIHKLSENLIKAIEAMSPARLFLSGGKPAEAVSPEQISLQYLLRAEAYYNKVQVAYGRMSEAQSESLGAQELENLFELELDKLKNQYETQPHRDPNSRKKELDEALQKLKDLAQRHQQLLESKESPPGPQTTRSGTSMSSGFQAVEQEAQKLARHLERLSREMQDPALDRASQQLGQAAQDLRAFEGIPPSRDSVYRGVQALGRMNEVQQLLDRKVNGTLAHDVGRLRSRAQNLRGRQEHVQRALDSLEKQSAAKLQEPADSGRHKTEEHLSLEKQQILQEKNDVAQSAKVMELEIREIARKAMNEQKAMSQKLQAAANFLGESRLEESVRQGGRLISKDLFEMAQQTEKNNLQIMKDLQQRLESAEKSLIPDQEARKKSRLSEALNRTDDLVRGLESLSRRIQEMQQASLRQTSLSPHSSSNKGENGLKAFAHSNQALSQPQQPAEQQSMSGNPANGKSIQATLSQSQKRDAFDRNGPTPKQVKPHGSRVESGAKGTEGTGNPSYEDNEHGNDAVYVGNEQLPPAMRLSDSTLRQLAREFTMRIQEARDLSLHLQGDDKLAHQLKNMIDRMHQMENLEFASDTLELDKLNSSVIEGFLALELRLSKDLQALFMKDSIRFAKDDDVPALYRNPVEEYYKSLSRK